LKVLFSGRIFDGELSVIFEGDARDAAAERLADEVVEGFGSLRDRKACGPNVGEAVAVGVGRSGAGILDEVGTEAVWGAETGTFPQEDEGQFCLEEGADFVLDGDTGEGEEGDGAEFPAGIDESRDEIGQERGDLFVAGTGGEAVGNHEGDVGRLVIGDPVLEEFSGIFGKFSTEVGTLEVFLAGVCGSGELQGFEAERIEVFSESVGVEGGVDGVSRAGVGEGEVEEFPSGEAAPRTADGDTGGSVGFEVRPRVGGDVSGVGHSDAWSVSSSRLEEGFRTRPIYSPS